MELTDSLKRFRKEFNLTQKAVADSAGMDKSSYQRYELGLREPAYRQLRNIADSFDVSIDYLVGRSNNPQVAS
ncbi:MAG: helix-turn-helix transcriptional regulator [Selenomonadaceae bacterium]|nr:helix-turn-helix transcriptional regulator [Selenomonadaceae bacterium]MBQ4403568.1 helix-turn-helix transcriptional regulator [Selenomonadaceae bacterium]